MLQQNEQVNLYKILGVKRDCTDKDIKKAFNQLVIKYHPDRGGDSEIYEIIVNAYNILVNTELRKQYDDLYKIEDISDYNNMRSNSKSYMNTQNKKATVDDHTKFKEGWDELNKKHGFYQESKDEMVISKKDATKKWQDLDKLRQKYYEEDKPDMIFENDKPINMATFNAAFETANGSILDIVSKKDIPDAWDGYNNIITNYSNIAITDNIYDESETVNEIHGINYSSIHFDKKPKKKITADDIKNVGQAKYYDDHNVIEDNYYDQIKEKLSERNLETNTFNNKELHQYDKENTAGYGIFEKLGIKYDDSLRISDWVDKDINNAYQKLLQDRNKI
jgi:curved DNA-binding protein CbpA